MKARKKKTASHKRVSARMLADLQSGFDEHVKLAEAINGQLCAVLMTAHGSAGWVRIAEIATRHHAGGLRSLAGLAELMGR